MTALPHPPEVEYFCNGEAVRDVAASRERTRHEMTVIELPGEPMPAARWKTTSNDGKQFKRYNQQKKDFRKWAGYQMPGQRYFEAGCRLAVEIHINRKNHVKADVDNLFKAITDPLNGLVYDDDSQIDEAHIYITRGVGLAEAGVVLKVWQRQAAPAQEAPRPQRLRLRTSSPGRHLRAG